MGIGMVIAVSENEAEKAVENLHAQGVDAKIIGRVVEGNGVTLV